MYVYIYNVITMGICIYAKMLKRLKISSKNTLSFLNMTKFYED